jgi:hypothetical protein
MKDSVCDDDSNIDSIVRDTNFCTARCINLSELFKYFGLLLGAAALHPSLKHLSESAPRSSFSLQL